MSESVLGTENIFKLFVKYCSLSVAAMVFLGLNTIVDGIFVGNLIGPGALASVNISMPVSSAFMAAAIAVGIGSQSVVGIGLGAGQRAAAQSMFRTAVAMIAFFSLSLTAALLLWTEPIARLLGASDRLLPMVAEYLSVIGVFLLPFGIMLVCDFMLKATGRPLFSMASMAAAVLFNMILNYLFIAKFGWGVKGAALATGCSYLASCIMVVLPFFSRHSTLNFYTGKISASLARRAAYNGSSEGLTEIATGFTTLLFNIVLMRFAGDTGVAAFSAINYLSFIGINILFGVSDGIGAIVSYNHGAKRVNRIKKVLKLAAAAALGIGCVLFLTVYFCGRGLVVMFLGAGDAATLAFAADGAKLYASAFLIMGLNMIASGYFTAVGKPGHSAAIACSKGIVLIAAGMFIWPKIFGISGVWLTVPLAELLTLGLAYHMMKKEYG